MGKKLCNLIGVTTRPPFPLQTDTDVKSKRIIIWQLCRTITTALKVLAKIEKAFNEMQGELSILKIIICMIFVINNSCC